jgi:hypothetical protein
MMSLLRVVLFTTRVHSLLHHLIVGTINGKALYSLEANDEARTVYPIQARDASGASPSLAIDVCLCNASSFCAANHEPAFEQAYLQQSTS